jgi:hypothetical protein
MFSSETKKEISDFIQELLQETKDKELPKGEISFILHVDGAKGWSWANIRNKSDRNVPVPNNLIRNLKH